MWNSRICIFDRNTYTLLRDVTIDGATTTEGLLQHCDGTIILADRGGSVHFLDENYNVLKTISGFRSPADVVLTPDGTLYITDYTANAIYLYSLY